MPNIVMFSVVLPSVIMLSVILTSAEALPQIQNIKLCSSVPGNGWVETNPTNIRKHLYLTYAKAVSVVPLGEVKTDIRWENTDVSWIGFHPLSGN
jgi:hypothetical protein